MSTLSVLISARSLFNDLSRWTQGSEARDADGNALDSATSSNATCWCLVGAVRRSAAQETEGSVFDDVEALRVLSRVIAPRGNPCSSAVLSTVTSFNDAESTCLSDVLCLLDSAIVSMRGSANWDLNCSVQPSQSV